MMFRIKVISELVGKSTLHPVVFFTGKATIFLCGFFFIMKWISPQSMLYDSRTTSIIGTTLYIAGFSFILIALLHLGDSAAVGIPYKETRLKTHGLYRFSRNPVYLSAFLMCIGSCLYAMHVLNILLFVVTVPIHHAIVKKEEEFLEKKFGGEWLEYKKRVPRYLWRL